MSRRRQSQSHRKLEFEQFEKRLLMSADGIGFQPTDVDQLVQQIAPQSSIQQTASRYGFDGSGQTIAVIDSGIAYDHQALGGGFGGNNKVVGGYDFAEDDADPYDDGPAGFHGTHVAGIAAGNGDGFQGVASGADLVGLRVFNDQGVGKIEWVESALQWVRNNLDSFRNPITTVNLSLGADGSESATDWSIINDELADLREQGVFISVAAGNNFANLQSQQLSSPADNPNVVPVASHDANNQLSDFSQRADNVLVAPGEAISSTVPNHLFGSRRADQLLGASGTSQAAPFVAGASAVLRQAYGAAGYGEVDQDTLYQTFLETSNQIYDEITQTTYHQLDLDAAIASVTESVAANREVTQVGTVSGGEVIRGTISDAGATDQYKFTAAATGQVELTFEATENIAPTLNVTDSFGEQVDLQFEGERVYIDVVSGDSYQLEVGSQSGTGHYQISTAFQQSATTTDLGIIDSVQLTENLDGEAAYSLTASNSGPITFGFSTDSIEGSIEVFDSNMNRLTSQTVSEGRVDFQFDVQRNETLTVLVNATGEATLSVDNLVSIENGTLTVSGTEQAESFVIRESSESNTLDVSVNGRSYSLDKTDISAIFIRGDAQQDTLQLSLSDSYERTVLRTNRVDSFDGGNTFRAIGFKEIDVFGSGSLTVSGSEADDSITANFEMASIGSATGHGFQTVIADGKGGNDSVTFQGSSANELLFSENNYTAIRNDADRLIAINYQDLSIDGGGGHDIANLFGTAGDDQFSLGDSIQVSDGEIDLDLTGFERSTSFSRSGSDAIVFTDSDGNDRFLFSDGTSQLVTESSHSVAHGFTDLTVNTAQGFDVAQIAGSGQNDTLTATRELSTLNVGDTTIELNQVDRVNVVANFQGFDSVAFTGTNGDDQLHVDSRSATTTFEGGSIVRAVGFANVSFDGLAGNDATTITGSAADEVLVTNSTETTFRGENTSATYRGVETTHFDGGLGNDAVYVDDALALDVIASIGERAIVVLERHQVEAENISLVESMPVDDIIGTYDMDRIDLASALRRQT